MSEPGKAPLSLFDATAREPDSLYDRWMEGSLDDTTERAVFDQLMGSTFERDEAVPLVLQVDAGPGVQRAHRGEGFVRVGIGLAVQIGGG